jgi:hypothetical protein
LFLLKRSISLLVRSFSLERPKQNKLVPQWNLGLVLAALNSPPFEPAEEVDLRFLYYLSRYMLRILIGQDNLEEASSGKAGIMTGSAPLSGI